MFGCFSCGAVFEAPLPFYEDSGERVYVCPHCYDYDLFTAHSCARCGGAFEEASLRWGLCPHCAAEVSGDFARALCALLDSYGEAEQAYLYGQYEGLV